MSPENREQVINGEFVNIELKSILDALEAELSLFLPNAESAINSLLFKKFAAAGEELNSVRKSIGEITTELEDKNCKSSKHNQILNKHRENALASFQAFIEVPTANKETKNAVLLEATRRIFGAQQTGYVVTENDDSPNKIIEIIKTIQDKG